MTARTRRFDSARPDCSGVPTWHATWQAGSAVDPGTCHLGEADSLAAVFGVKGVNDRRGGTPTGAGHPACQGGLRTLPQDDMSPSHRAVGAGPRVRARALFGAGPGVLIAGGDQDAESLVLLRVDLAAGQPFVQDGQCPVVAVSLAA